MDLVDRYLIEHEFAIISSAKKGSTIELDKTLRAVLLYRGFGVCRLNGVLFEQECNSLDLANGGNLVINLARLGGTIDNDFKGFICALSEKMNQHAFVYSTNNSTKGYIIGTTLSSWLGGGQIVEIVDFINIITARCLSFPEDHNLIQSHIVAIDTLYSYNILSRQLIANEACCFLESLHLHDYCRQSKNSIH